MFDWIALRRSSSSPAIRPRANFLRMNRTIRNVTSVQMLSPRSGLIRPLLSSSSAASARNGRYCRAPSISSGDEEGDEGHEQGVEGDGLRQREAEEHHALEVAAQLGLPRDALDRLADQVPHAHAGPDRAEGGAEAERQRLGG